MIEYYIITDKQQSRFPALLLAEEYGGWSKFHCTRRGGAFILTVKKVRGKWQSDDSRYSIAKIEEVSRDQYLKELVKCTC